MAIAFTFSGSLSTGTNRFLLSNNTNVADTFSEHVRVKTVYITALTNFCTASVYAGMTQIVPWKFPTLTGSADPGLSGSIPDPVFGYDGLG